MFALFLLLFSLDFNPGFLIFEKLIKLIFYNKTAIKYVVFSIMVTT